MARISLYVPDELRARMDAAGDKINWSDVARPALTAAIVAFEHRKRPSVSTAIERLRASKKLAEQDRGNRDGRAWAQNDADYPTLCFLSSHVIPHKDPLHELHRWLDPEDGEFTRDKVFEYLAGPKEKYDDQSFLEEVRRLKCESDEYFVAFIVGAVHFFKEVRDEVERPHPAMSLDEAMGLNLEGEPTASNSEGSSGGSNAK